MATLVATVAAVAIQAGVSRQVPPYAPGYPHLFPRPTDTRPRDGALLVADLDHDGRNEVIASVPSGVVTVVGPGGQVRPGWPRSFGTLPQPAWPVGQPGIGDLDGDGNDEIVTCLTTGPPLRRIVLVALRADGTDLPGWPVDLGPSGAGQGCAPNATLVADLDGDGRCEVIRAEGASVHVLGGDGWPLPGWPWEAPPDTLGRSRAINADPIAVDLDLDGRREIVVVESGYEPRLFALGAFALPAAHFPVTLAEVVDRQAPATADLDGDGLVEIVQATLPFEGDFMAAAPADESGFQPWPGADSTSPSSGPLVPAALHTLRFDGTPAAGWPVGLGGGARYGAIAADLEGDERLEILQGDGDRLAAYDGLGRSLRGFPLVVRGLPRGAEARIDTQWSVADLDGDGRHDLLRVSGFIEAGAASLRVIGLQAPGPAARGYPFTVDGVLPSSPVVATDLTGDGLPEIIILASEGANGGWRLLAWDPAGVKGR